MAWFSICPGCLGQQHLYPSTLKELVSHLGGKGRNDPDSNGVIKVYQTSFKSLFFRPSNFFESFYVNLPQMILHPYAGKLEKGKRLYIV